VGILTERDVLKALRPDISPDAGGDLVPDGRAVKGKEYPHDRM
jgi:CBS domain-containing protein